MKDTNIVGEPFAKYVNDQIEQRQLVYGDGFGSQRGTKYIQYLNSRLSWVKMASSVIINPDPASEVNIAQIITTGEDGTFRLKDLGIDVEQFKGYKLASNFILFNGVQQGNFKGVPYEDETSGKKGIDPTTTNKFLSYTKRAGIATSNSNWNNSSYGLGGTDFGLQPMPGITSLDIKHLNRGSIRKATINLKAYNKFQFEVIDTLYLRLGFNMLLEWGNSHYIESSGLNPDNTALGAGNIDYVRNTLTEDVWFNAKYSTSSNTDLLNQIEKYRKKYDGNYDGFMGRVTNFNWSYNTDGSYDISIELSSLGDVVESLKVNIANDPESLSTDKPENTDTITTFLNNLSNTPTVFNTVPSGSNHSDFLDITALAEIEGILNDYQHPDDDELRYYIRFGNFLDFIQKHILIYFHNGGEKPFPIVNLDYDSETNIMPIYPNQISLDPKVCLIRTNYFSPPAKRDFFFYKPMAKFSSDTDLIYGKIMNIYINFNTIKEKIKSNIDSKGNLSLFNFLKSLCDEINKALGGVNNLEPIVIEDKNTLVIFDQNNYTNRDDIRKQIKENLKKEKEEKTSFPIDLYGYNSIHDNKTRNNKTSSNFVKNYSFSTEISPDLATMMTIGATSEGSVVGEDATAFTQWNKGLTDRFKQFQAPNPPIPTPKGKTKTEEKQAETITIGYTFSPGQTYTTATTYGLEQQQKRFIERLKSNYPLYLTKLIGKDYGGHIPGYNAPYTAFNSNTYSENVSLGKQSFKNYISGIVQEKKEAGVVTGTMGFIPVKLSITLDGISGIKIYNKLQVNTKFLPSNYPDVLEFIVKQVNHSLKDNKWETTIETISVPVVTEIPIDTNLSVIELPEEILPPGLLFDLPIQNLGFPPKIREDAGGSGFYGANRSALQGSDTPRKHTGVDFSTTIGQEIYAPIPGKILKSKASNTSKLDGIKILGNGDYKGITVYIFYSQLSLSQGTIVTQNEKIGNALDLSPDYPEEVTDHIHFKIEYNGNIINPENIFYKFNNKELQGNLIFGRNAPFITSSF